MIAQLPSNMLLTRVRPGIYLPCTTLIWSGVSIATAFTTNASTLFTVRFFLGITEAPLFPGAVFLMSCWYTRKELALRTSILYSHKLFRESSRREFSRGSKVLGGCMHGNGRSSMLLDQMPVRELMIHANVGSSSSKP